MRRFSTRVGLAKSSLCKSFSSDQDGLVGFPLPSRECGSGRGHGWAPRCKSSCRNQSLLIVFLPMFEPASSSLSLTLLADFAPHILSRLGSPRPSSDWARGSLPKVVGSAQTKVVEQYGRTRLGLDRVNSRGKGASVNRPKASCTLKVFCSQQLIQIQK